MTKRYPVPTQQRESRLRRLRGSPRDPPSDNVTPKRDACHTNLCIVVLVRPRPASQHHHLHLAGAGPVELG
ncbi:MAG: hypothetical protein RQ748_13240, partial [Elusimicrobiales bacterium]|nr:hypothetical protein [Elusimicrobiales bacterium]